jgi:hypothetical protein
MMQSEHVRICAEIEEKNAQSADDGTWENVLVPGLMAYKQVYRNLLIERAFVVPSQEPWPERLWGAHLGQKVDDVRWKGTYVSSDPARVEWLDSQGFVWDDACAAGEYQGSEGQSFEKR